MLRLKPSTQAYNGQYAWNGKMWVIILLIMTAERFIQASASLTRGGPRQQQINILIWSVVLWEVECTAISGRLLLCGARAGVSLAPGWPWGASLGEWLTWRCCNRWRWQWEGRDGQTDRPGGEACRWRTVGARGQPGRYERDLAPSRRAVTHAAGVWEKH